MQHVPDFRHDLSSLARRPLLRRLFCGKLSRLLLLMFLLLLASAAALGLSIGGSAIADWIALGLALAAIALLALLFYRMRRRFRFLKNLREWAERMRGGNLSAKIPYTRELDLDDVIEDVNSLGGMLEKLAHEMDAHAHNQTVRLARKTQSLDILYEIASSLTRPGTLDRQLEGFLDTFIELVDARAATVHLADEGGRVQRIASRGLAGADADNGEKLAERCPYCGWSLTRGTVHVLTRSLDCARRPEARKSPDPQEIAVVPVQYQSRTLGIYTLYLTGSVVGLGEDTLDLLTGIGRHLGLAVEKARLDNDARRLAIMEERNMLANELHDSLAQALVGMRLQIKMLGETLHKKDLRTAQEEARRLRAAVEEAHASLRELLANFRLKIDDGGLVPAIARVVERFNRETNVAVFFQNECGELTLAPAQEIHIFRIVQEALANIRKHSDARNARVLLSQNSDGRYTLLIEDDGRGLAPPEPGLPGEHLGLSIMRERAQRLPGELSIESEPGEGLRISLTFDAVASAPTAAVPGQRA